MSNEQQLFGVRFTRPVQVSTIDPQTGKSRSRFVSWVTGFTSKYAAKAAIKRHGVDGTIYPVGAGQVSQVSNRLMDTFENTYKRLANEIR